MIHIAFLNMNAQGIRRNLRYLKKISILKLELMHTLLLNITVYYYVHTYRTTLHNNTH